jgi:hypothetical protein
MIWMLMLWEAAPLAFLPITLYDLAFCQREGFPDISPELAFKRSPFGSLGETLKDLIWPPVLRTEATTVLAAVPRTAFLVLSVNLGFATGVADGLGAATG